MKTVVRTVLKVFGDNSLILFLVVIGVVGYWFSHKIEVVTERGKAKLVEARARAEKEIREARAKAEAEIREAQERAEEELRAARRKAEANPPISASFRWSHLGENNGGVLIIANLSAQKGVIVTIYRDETGRESQEFLIKANDEREFGEWQIGANFFSGQTGHVNVEGSQRKLYFKFENGKYKTWFDD